MSDETWPYRVEIHWRSYEGGGRETGPPAGPMYYPTMIPQTEDPEQSLDHFSVALSLHERHAGQSGQVADAKPFSDDIGKECMKSGSRLLVMEGRRVVGEALVLQADNAP